jgi:hypothetical protein
MPTDWAELDPLQSRWTKRFIASFTVDPDAKGDGSWQQFPKAIFTSPEKAKGNALAVAMSAIDQKLAAA